MASQTPPMTQISATPEPNYDEDDRSPVLNESLSPSPAPIGHLPPLAISSEGVTVAEPPQPMVLCPEM